MCERALGHDNYSQGGGGWVASGVTGRVSLLGHSITVHNPNGAVIQGVTEVSCYTVTAGSLIQGSTTLDGSGQTVWGLFFFNTTGEHTQFKWCWAYSAAAGAHSVTCGLWIAAGSIQFDGNDGGTSSVWERP
jgi:hypothetical protein